MGERGSGRAPTSPDSARLPRPQPQLLGVPRPEPIVPDLARLARDVEWLRRLAQRLIADPGRAEDVAQETWLVALRPQARAPRVDRRWLAGTLHNLARLGSRQEVRRGERERRAARPERLVEDEVPHEVRAGSTSEVDLALVGHRRLVDAVLALPDAQRQVLVLRYWRDLTPTEIAIELGEQTASVKGRLRRALAELRARVVDLDDERAGGATRTSSAPALLAFIARGGAAPLHPSSASPLIALLMTKHVVLLFVALAALALLARFTERSSESDAGALREVTHPTAAVLDAPFAAEPSVGRVAVAPPAEAPPWTVDRACDLHGVVIGPDGVPRGDALVRVHATRWSEPVGTWGDDPPAAPIIAEAPADSLGRYRIPLELGELYDVIAEAPGFARATATRRLAGERVDLQLAESRSISGRVLLDGAPVLGARVSLGPRLSYMTGPAFLLDERSTDGQGGYTFTDVARGAYVLAVVAQDLVPPRPRRIDVGDEDVEHDIALERGRVVRGRVVDAVTRDPIVECTVRAGVKSNATSCAVGELGEFELTAVPIRRGDGDGGRSLALVAEAPGYVTKLVSLPFQEADVAAEELVLALERGASIRGRVVVGEGAAPPAGTRVLAVTLEQSWSPLAGRERRAGRVEDDGHFEVDGLRTQLRPIRADAPAIIAAQTAQSALFIDAPGFAAMVWILPTLELGAAPLDLGTLRLTRAGSVSGRVIDGEGAPVAHAMVSVTASESWTSALPPEKSGVNPTLGLLTSVTLDTDDLGRFHRGGLPPGEVVVNASLPGSTAKADAHVSLAEGQAIGDVELQLDLAGVIEGQVLDDEGRAVPGAHIHVSREGVGDKRALEANEAGRFRISGLGEGSFRLWVFEATSDRRSGALHMPVTIECVAAGTVDLNIVLPAATTLRGVARSSAGAPLPGAKLRLEFAGSYPTIELSADAEGRFERQVPRDERVDIWVAPQRAETNEPYEYVLVSAGWVASEEPLELIR
jgi:RNA polymerase sigma-70 factor (ECF subfamily)